MDRTRGLFVPGNKEANRMGWLLCKVNLGGLGRNRTTDTSAQREYTGITLVWRRKAATRIARAAGEPMGIAGLCSWWKSPKGALVYLSANHGRCTAVNMGLPRAYIEMGEVQPTRERLDDGQCIGRPSCLLALDIA